MSQRLKIISVLTIAATALIILMLNTNPSELPLYLLFIPFFMIYIICYCAMYLLVSFLVKERNTIVKRWLAGSLAVLPVLLLILQSSGQISIRDVLIVAGLVIALLFYFKKTDFLQ